MTWAKRKRRLKWLYRLGLRERPVTGIARYQRFIEFRDDGSVYVDLGAYWSTPTGRLHLQDTCEAIRKIPLNVPLDL